MSWKSKRKDVLGLTAGRQDGGTAGRQDSGTAIRRDMMHCDYLHPCILGSKKDLPATRTCLTQAGARASKSFCHPRLGRMTNRKRRGMRLRSTGQLEEEEKAQEQEENRGQGNIGCVQLDWQQCFGSNLATMFGSNLRARE